MDGMGSPDGMMDHSMMDLKGGMGSPYSCYSSPKLPYDSFSNRGGLEYHLSWLLICSSRWFEPEPDEDGVAVAPEPARGRLRVQLWAISPLWPPLLPLAHRRRPVSSQRKFILRWKSLQLPWPWSSRDHEVKPSLVFHIVLLQRSFGTVREWQTVQWLEHERPFLGKTVCCMLSSEGQGYLKEFLYYEKKALTSVHTHKDCVLHWSDK